MRAFVTGASSAIGRSVVERLAPDVELLLLRHRSPVPAVEGAEILEGSLADLAAHAEAIRSADVVLHVAGLTHAKTLDEYLRVNRDGTARLLSVCRPEQRFVYVSTRCVGEAGGAYSHSKALAEAAVTESGLPSVIVRPAEVFGTSEEGIDALIGIALRRRVLVDLRAWPEVRYSPVHHDELAALLAAVVRDEGDAGVVYTVCNDRDYTIRDMRRALEAGLGRRVLRLPVPLALLRLLAALRLPLPFQRDQLARLVMPRSSDNSLARERHGFAPRDFLEVLEGTARARRG